jgi:lipid A 3-O-deacylase
MRLPVGALAVCVLVAALAWGAPECLAQDAAQATVPARYGLAVDYGHGYNPSDLEFVMLSGVALFDYDAVWPHRAPEALRFKVELSAGSATRPSTRLVASANIFALYYLDMLATGGIRPYVEGGIGGIYTDFQVPGQGSRLNFNPQLGIGAEFEVAGGTYFTAVRLHHASNAGLASENRGLNSVLMQAGRLW